MADQNESHANRVEALKFLVHFVADIHQPLHAIGEARGGNEIHILEFGSSKCGSGLCNLHAAWDTGLIAHAARSEEEYVADIEKLISRRNLQLVATGSPVIWASESFHLAHQVWLQNGGSVDEAYFRSHIENLNERLALAGLRLAAVLNQALGN